MRRLLDELQTMFYSFRFDTPLVLSFATASGERLCTFNGTQHRRGSEPLGSFLQRRWLAMEAGEAAGVWLVPGQVLFDIELEVRPPEKQGAPEVIEVCNCGFYARIDGKETGRRYQGKTVDVAVRYEADFENTGHLWADHPHHHLQWDPIQNVLGTVDGARMVRSRTPPMLPTHFFEFCLRHFLPDWWKQHFGEPAALLGRIAEGINASESNVSEHRRQLVAARLEQAREQTRLIREACEPPEDVRWAWSVESESTCLPL